MKKKWELKNKNITESNNDSQKNEIINKYKLGNLVSAIISEKGLSEKEIEIFLNPTRVDFHDPFEMPDMKKAVDRILKAIKNNEKTIIYGDYDADGITSSTILKRFFKDLDFNVDVYIPNRLDEGYGLNKDAINYIKEEGYTLIITVDCGITAVDEIDLANSLGIDVVVTDHHEPAENLPEAIAVVDCKRKDNKYPFRELAGCGVAFKLTMAIAKKLELAETSYLKYIDIACVGTIADIVPLVDENRVICKLGLLLLKQTKIIGLRILLESIGYKKLDSSTISFGIAPRINACGRMGHEKDALELFLTDDIIEARKLVEKLNMYNNERQQIEKKMFEEAKELVDADKNNAMIIVGKENWHHGVIGIVSSKVTEMYYKPSILYSIEEETAKGSGRSIQGFDLHEALENSKKYIKQFGGHSMAVGVTLELDKIEEFKKSMQEYAKACKIDEIIPIINIESIIEIKDLSVKEISDLSLLEPYGEGNSRPIYQINNVKITSKRSISDGKHLKLSVTDERDREIECIGFNMGELSSDYIIGDKIDLVGNLEINSYMGIDKVQINLKDIRHTI